MFVLPIRFENSPRLHLMQSRETYQVQTKVVVQGKRGPEVAIVRGQPQAPQPKERYGIILGKASESDLIKWAELQDLAESLKWLLRAKARERRLAVKIVAVEFTLDENLVTISYSAEERIELSSLISELRDYTKARVNFAAVGPREQAQILGALGACGRENCSSNHLQEFAPVSIRMAREQQLPLNPDKLSGPCGRLLCCLHYEHEQYSELLRDLPRRNSRVCHEKSGVCGKVSKLHPLLGTVDIHTENGPVNNLPADELTKERDLGGREQTGYHEGNKHGHHKSKPHRKK